MKNEIIKNLSAEKELLEVAAFQAYQAALNYVDLSAVTKALQWEIWSATEKAAVYKKEILSKRFPESRDHNLKGLRREKTRRRLARQYLADLK